MWEGVTSAVLGQKMFGEDGVYCKMEGGTYRTWSKLDNRDGKVGDDIQQKPAGNNFLQVTNIFMLPAQFIWGRVMQMKERSDMSF